MCSLQAFGDFSQVLPAGKYTAARCQHYASHVIVFSCCPEDCGNFVVHLQHRKMEWAKRRKKSHERVASGCKSDRVIDRDQAAGGKAWKSCRETQMERKRERKRWECKEGS